MPAQASFSEHPGIAPAQRLLQALFSVALPEQCLEIRAITPDGKVRQSYHPLGQLQQRGFQLALPLRLDGHANVYFSVCPRHRQGGKAADVAAATCLWVDEITRPWPQSLPHPAALVETSPGKHQGYWPLDALTPDLDRVERLNRALAAALGGDNVGDRARVLRIPGFLNVKPAHPNRPRARLLRCDPARRFALDDLAQALASFVAASSSAPKPSSPKTSCFPHPGAARHAQRFSPPPPIVAEIDAELRRRGFRPGADGRLAGPCPFSHASGAVCDCDRAFYWSPTSGVWSCFCSDHLGHQVASPCVSGGAWKLWETLFPVRAAFWPCLRSNRLILPREATR